MTAPHGNDNSSHVACREPKVYHNKEGPYQDRPPLCPFRL